MKNKIIKIVLITLLSIIFVSSSAVSGGSRSGHYKNSPSGWQKRSGHYKNSPSGWQKRSGYYKKSPSGWEKGKKQGWHSEKPPGMDKNDYQFNQKGKNSEKRLEKSKSKSGMESEFDKHDDALGNEKVKSN